MENFCYSGSVFLVSCESLVICKLVFIYRSRQHELEQRQQGYAEARQRSNLQGMPVSSNTIPNDLKYNIHDELVSACASYHVLVQIPIPRRNLPVLALWSYPVSSANEIALQTSRGTPKVLDQNP